MTTEGSETVGFIDVGTNSIHLLVARFFDGSVGTPVFQDKETVRLGQSLYSTGSIDPGIISKSALVVSRFARISREMGADRVVAYATCAAREASNSRELMSALSGAADVQVIPGTEEARLTALGVFGTSGPSERTVLIDIGGGSTEVVVAEGGANLFIDSLAMGAVRYAYGLGVDNTLAVSDRDYSEMRRNVDVSSYRASSAVRSLGFTRAVGSSGTLIALAEMCAAVRPDGDPSYMTRSELSALMRDVRSRDLRGRHSVPGLGRGRADIIVAGGAIAEELMTLFGIERMEISTRGLKQGMQADHLLSRGYTMFETRDASVRALACRCHYDRKHAEAVRVNGLRIFDMTRGLGLHGMSDGMRSLLASACTLHDIGEFVNYTNHHVMSQMIIESSDMVGFTCTELHHMGLMVRLHHKRFPGPKDPLFSDIPRPVVDDIRRCALFLRMADVLDRHRTSTVTDLTMAVSDGTLVLGVVSSEDPSMEIWRLGRLRGDFRKLFGLELQPEPVPASGDDGVARCQPI